MHRALRRFGGSLSATAATATRPLATGAAPPEDGPADRDGNGTADVDADAAAAAADGAPAVPDVPAPAADYGTSLDVDDGDADAVRAQVEADAAREAVDNPAKEPADAAADVRGDGTVYNGAEPGKA